MGLTSATSAGSTCAADAAANLHRYAIVFEPGDPPRSGHLLVWDPAGAEPPEGLGTRDEASVAVPAGSDVAVRTVCVARAGVGDALAALARVEGADPTHPAAAFWGAAARLALHMVARGRILPGVSAGDLDTWRVSPLEAGDAERIRELAAAMPPEARAIPLPHAGEKELMLPDAAPLLRAFLDAVADTLPRTGGDGPAYAASQPYHVPELREWAEELGAGGDVRISLRLEAAHPEGESFRAVVQLHSLADPTLVSDARESWEQDLPGFGERARTDTLISVRRAARQWTPLEELLRRPVPDAVALTVDEVAELAGPAGARLSAAGIEVHWPRELARDLTATALIRGGESLSDLPSLLGGDRLLEVNWRLALGGRELHPAEIDRLAEARRPLVRLRDQWVVVPPDLARKAREPEAKPVSALDAVAATLSGTAVVDGEVVEAAGTGWLQALRDRIADPEAAAEPRDQPAALAAALRDYQLRGMRWLHQLTSLGLGGCLADDMGLGKTITLIALHLHRQDYPETAGPTLVVCPASLLGNWEREVQRFAPGTPVHRFHGPGRSLEGGGSGFVLTTYGTMRLDTDRLAAQSWGLVVADEAQHVKNPTSQGARELRRIPGRARVALTGTPVENNLSELWAILDWAVPGLLGTLPAFRERWAAPIESGRGADAAGRLSRLVRPFLLRRRKSDPGIAPELPSKTETDHPVALTDEQVGLYEAAVREAMERIRGSSGMARRGEIMRLLTSLKQICNHPEQYLKEHKGEGAGVGAGVRLGGRAGKLELLDELLDTIRAEDGAVLVFTQYVAMARLIERHLHRRGIGAQLLHGGLPVAERDAMVRRFQDSPAGAAPVFLLSLKAGGTGLNLTRADHVVHYDRWWNPAVEEQATDRAYRIGQTRPVQVHRLITEGTVEDRIAAMLEAKRGLAEAVLSSGEAALTELSDADLAELVELRRSQ